MTATQSNTMGGFDLIRISRSKSEVGICPNTVRAYGRLGLRIHHVGKATFFSRTELANLITSGVLATAMKAAAKRGAE